MPETMTGEKWDTFFELMAEVVNMPGTWMTKADRVKQEADARDAGSTLAEFINWFPEEE